MPGPAARPQIFGPYLLLRPLGEGAMGQVFLARPLDPERGVPSPLVVKQLRPELADRKSFAQRFQHEAEVVVSVDSAHVAKVYDAGQVGEVLYIAMEYVPGWPLTKVLERVLASGRHAPVPSLIELVRGGLEGLTALHEAKDAAGRALEIVHRDLSPKNLLVGEDGRMMIIDLGLGRSKLQQWKTRTGVVMGSVGYMAPEQARGERVDARADVYAMGVVLWEMLALRNYITPGPVAKMMDACLRPKWTSLLEHRPDVSPALDRVVAKALAAKREDRYESARDFGEALAAVAPRAGGSAGIVGLLELLFGTRRMEDISEIEEILKTPLPDGDTEDDSGKTRVFATRTGVRALSDAGATQPLVRAAARPPRPSPAPARTTTVLTVRTRAFATAGPPVAILSAALLAAGVLAGLALYGGGEAREEQDAPLPVDEVAGPQVTVREAPPPEPQRLEPIEPALVAPPPAPPPPPSPPRRVATPAAPSVDERLAELEARIVGWVETHRGTPEEGEALRLLRDVRLLRESRDPERRAAQLPKLEARLPR